MKKIKLITLFIFTILFLSGCKLNNDNNTKLYSNIECDDDKNCTGKQMSYYYDIETKEDGYVEIKIEQLDDGESFLIKGNKCGIGSLMTRCLEMKYKEGKYTKFYVKEKNNKANDIKEESFSSSIQTLSYDTIEYKKNDGSEKEIGDCVDGVYGYSCHFSYDDDKNKQKGFTFNTSIDDDATIAVEKIDLFSPITKCVCIKNKILYDDYISINIKDNEITTYKNYRLTVNKEDEKIIRKYIYNKKIKSNKELLRLYELKILDDEDLITRLSIVHKFDPYNKEECITNMRDFFLTTGYCDDVLCAKEEADSVTYGLFE